MRTGSLDRPDDASAIVRLLGGEDAASTAHGDAPGAGEGGGPSVDGATSPAAGEARATTPEAVTAPERARAFAAPLLESRALATGEDALAHADGVAAILRGIGAAPTLQAAAYLVHAGDFLTQPEAVIAKAFGESSASLVTHTRRLMEIQRAARETQHRQPATQRRAGQTERVRKMLLAFSKDLRVVLLRLASRLQTLRHHAQSRRACPPELADESLHVFAPLANRLGIWQIKWELEDLSFRFLQPDTYREVARLLDEKRVERERRVERARRELAAALAAAGIAAEVQGRPKHLYSIWKKMRGKGLDFARVFDVRALRVIVATVDDCYAALSRVHELYAPVPAEFDDYIARPKPNGYQSLHTVVTMAGEASDGPRPVEIQIRTRAMHEHAEHGVAAHWAYKEAGARGYAGVSAAGDFDARLAEARRAVLKQLLAWERDAAADEAGAGGAASGHFDDRIYVFTPQAAVIELPAGATAIDFAYALHTDLGHRCRGARVDGQMVPLDTPLANGQTVEVIAAKEGGPSLDWLNAEAGYLKSARAKAKVRVWFNAQAQRETIARGREAVEKLLQREGRVAMKLDLLAARLGFRSADALFEVVGKDEFSLRNIETLLRQDEPAPPAPDAGVVLKRPRADASAPGGVLVVGVESLLTSLARCCRPAPPDAIAGYVTRGKGVAVHRAACSNFRQMAGHAPERVIPVAWAAPRTPRPDRGPDVYPVDVVVEADDRQGLMRDVSEVFAKEKMNVVSINSQSVKQAQQMARPGAKDTAWMGFTVEVDDASRLAAVLRRVAQVPGVRGARRR